MYNVKYFVSFYEEGKFLNKLEVWLYVPSGINKKKKSWE